jgi:hypothetical protein
MGAKTRLTCPNCNQKSSTSAELKAGTKVRCPACHQSFAYVPETEDILLAEIEAEPAALKKSLGSGVKAPDKAGPIRQVQPPSAPPVQVVNVNVPAPRKGNPLAIAALVLGIIAALLCWIPWLGLFSIPVALLGLVLGLIGLALAVIGRRSGLAASIVGAGISLGSIALAVLITVRASKAFTDSWEKTQKEQRAVAKAVDDRGHPVVAQPKTEPTEVGIPQPSPIEKGQDVPAAKSSEEWVTAPTPAKLGDVIVKVSTVKIDRVPLKGITGEGQSQEPLLMVSLEISNTNPNRKIDYKSWAGEQISFGRDFASLKDNNGNSYKRISFGFSERVIGRSDSDSIYPEKALGDILVFEIPLKTAEALHLELPAPNVGEKGFFRIRIPASMIGQ